MTDPNTPNTPNTPIISATLTRNVFRRLHRMIWVTFDIVGFHAYVNAPEEVSYLRSLHRHVFKFKVGITVKHDDREIEFHMFQSYVKGLFETEGGPLVVDNKSCEMLAQDIIESIQEHYDCSSRKIEVTVSEDGECGATLTSTPA